MIYPFDAGPPPHDRRLKPASCSIPFAGTVIYWTPKYDKPEFRVRRGP